MAAGASAQQFPDQGCRVSVTCTTSAHTPVPHMTLNVTPKRGKKQTAVCFSLPWKDNRHGQCFGAHGRQDTKQRTSLAGIAGFRQSQPHPKTSLDHVARCLSQRQNPPQVCTSPKITNSSSLFSMICTYTLGVYLPWGEEVCGTGNHPVHHATSFTPVDSLSRSVLN